MLSPHRRRWYSVYTEYNRRGANIGTTYIKSPAYASAIGTTDTPAGHIENNYG